MKDKISVEKMYTYLRGYCEAKDYTNSLISLPLAREIHSEQKRKDGEPYIIHPMFVAVFLIDLGIDSDVLLASSLLHDTIEDQQADLTIVPIANEIKQIVWLLTFIQQKNETKDEALKDYYAKIQNCIPALLIKLVDRLHNLSTMANAFSTEKMQEYVLETVNYVLPLIKIAKKQCPTLRKPLWIIEQNIYAIINTVSHFVLNEKPLYLVKKQD